VRAASFHPAILSLQNPLVVSAVFDRAWHLVDTEGIVLTVGIAPYDGPMAIRMEGRLPAAMRPGRVARLDARALTIGTVRIELAGARPWSGDRIDMPPIDGEALRRDLQQIRQTTPAGPLLPRLAALRRSLESGAEEELREAARMLIGLGPGLTPAGDDVLGGVLVGMHVFGRRLVASATRDPDRMRRAGTLGHAGRARRTRDRLAAIVVEEMHGRTTALSRTLLIWAGQGVAVQPLLDVLWTLGSGAPLDALEAVVALGHTSGPDMLAGAALAATRVLGGDGDTSVDGSP
jgi:hypothetical protein